jgi:hypothetical protein
MSRPRPTLEEMQATLERLLGAGWLADVGRTADELSKTLARTNTSPGVAAAALVDLLVTIIQARACDRDSPEQAQREAERLAADTAAAIIRQATDAEAIATAWRLWQERMT